MPPKKQTGGGAFGSMLRRLADEFENDRKEHTEEHARLFAIIQAIRARVDRIEADVSKLLAKRSGG